jgi:hypothetical protein|tara:strand:- start:393 stop:779 length:387 start_codon:yes stop_codon:yes gene_type:complete
MPVTIDGTKYTMEKITNLSIKRFELSKKIEERLKLLRNEFHNDEIREKREILMASKLSKVKKNSLFYNGKNVIEISKTKNGVMATIARDMAELSHESKLINEINELFKKLVELTQIEREYFSLAEWLK